MLIGEDDYDRRVAEYHPYIRPREGMSKAELRKSNKPIMEKRRRARINRSLNELKSLILDAMKKDPARHSKLEKADILEMTVNHLQGVQRRQMARAMASDPTVVEKFRRGFEECAAEVATYVAGIPRGEPEAEVGQRLAAHLTALAKATPTALQSPSPPPPSPSPTPAQPPPSDHVWRPW